MIRFILIISALTLTSGCFLSEPAPEVIYCHEQISNSAKHDHEITSTDVEESSGGEVVKVSGNVKLQNGYGAVSTESYTCRYSGSFLATIDNELISFGGRKPKESDYSVDSDNGIVTDKKTGLMWTRCSVGQAMDSPNCEGNAKALSYYDAKNAARKFTLAGYSDWRIPTARELYELVYCDMAKEHIEIIDSGNNERLTGGYCRGPISSRTIIDSVFPNTALGSYSTSTITETVLGEMKVNEVSFGTGTRTQIYNKDNYSRYVRLVRDPE